MLRNLQKERIRKFLNPSPDFFWKVIILDDNTKDIISPLLKLNELRDLGITTHFPITSQRQKICDVPAIYFISPTPENIEILKKDVLNNLYTGYFVNFTTNIDRKTLENIAYTLSQKQKALQIQAVYDQYVDFVALQNDLFILNQKNSFTDLNDTMTWKDTTQKLFSVFLTLNEIPFMITKKCNEDCVTKNIMNMLVQRIKNTNIVAKTRKRPLLVVLDRTFDIYTPFEHVWSYNSLINDLLLFKLNKVTIKDKAYELDSSDPFWIENQHEYFPVVADKIEKELMAHKKEMALKCIDDRTDKKKIDEVLEKAPELARKNEMIQTHMAICVELVDIIKKRNIDDFYQLEKGKFKNDELVELSEKGNESDIIRLAVNLKNNANNDEMVRALLKKRNIDDRILEYVSEYKDDTVHQNHHIYSQVVSNILGNVKKLLPVNVECPIYKEVENIYNSVRNQNFSELLFMDSLGNHTVYEKEISSIVVFCLGGGTLNEFNSLKNLEKKIGVPIVFGCSEMLNGEEFTRQVCELNENQ